MQLFTIGLVKLRQDGTLVRDAAGQPIQTYDNDDIMTFSRIWTGFDRQSSRGNVECRSSQCSNWIDPMQIKPAWRDVMPKTDLSGGFIGDALPLCLELPRRAFLHAGATFRYLGYSRQPQLQADPTTYETTALEVVLDRNASSLYALLCQPTADGTHCSYPSEVVLQAELPCHGAECSVDTLRVVKVVDGDEDVFYEYVRSACVQLAFFSSPTVVQNGRSNKMCADPRAAAGTPPGAG